MINTAPIQTCIVWGWLFLCFPGLQDYEAALKIDPNNKQVCEDADKMRKIIQSSSESW